MSILLTCRLKTTFFEVNHEKSHYPLFFSRICHILVWMIDLVIKYNSHGKTCFEIVKSNLTKHFINYERASNDTYF